MTLQAPAARTHLSRLVAPGPEILGLLPEDASDAATLVALGEALIAEGAAAVLVDDDAQGDARAQLLAAAGVEVRRATAAPVVRRGSTDPRELARLLAEIEPLRGRQDVTVATDAVAETVRFLAVLAVLDGRAAMPDYDLDDPHLKWHARPGVRAVPNPPTIVASPAASSAASPADETQGGGA